MVNKILLIIKSPPYGSGKATEGLRMATAMIAMDVLPKIMFVDDGVYCLIKNQNPETAGFTSVQERLKTIADLVGTYTVSPSLATRNLKNNDLEDEYNTKIVSFEEATELVRDSEAVITF